MRIERSDSCIDHTLTHTHTHTHTSKLETVNLYCDVRDSKFVSLKIEEEREGGGETISHTHKVNYLGTLGFL